MKITAVADARKIAESQLTTLDNALRLRVERKMQEGWGGLTSPGTGTIGDGGTVF